MKTIKIRISLTDEQSQAFCQYTSEMEWLWNLILSNMLNNQCLEWYKWANNQSKKLAESMANTTKKKSKKDTSLDSQGFLPFNLDDIIECPLQFGSSAYIGVSCKIAEGGNYWKKDETIKIPYKAPNGEIKHKVGYQLIEANNYRLLPKMTHSYKYLDITGREFKNPNDFDRVECLNIIRASQGLPKLTIPSDYISGLIQKDFVPAWEAWKSPVLVNRKKLRFKNKANRIHTLTNNQPNSKTKRMGAIVDHDNATVKIPGLGVVTILDRNYKKRLNQKGYIPRTYSVTQNASGFYLCVVIAPESIIEIKQLEKQLIQAKKEHGIESDQYLALKAKIQHLESESIKSRRIKQKGLSAGIDPGVKAVVATDHGALFTPNLKRDRIEVRIEKLQSQLNKLKNINDKVLGKNRVPTKNESKLQAKITRLHERASNTTKAFNHKLSTRLARTYTVVCWEDSHISNMIRRAAPKLSESGYEKNGASAKSGLNRMLRMRSLSDLKEKTRAKVETAGGEFKDVKAPYSSQECSTCGEKGARLNQHSFMCTNSKCNDFEVIKNADTNAAKNHKRNGGQSSDAFVKYSTPKLAYTAIRRYKQIIAESDNVD